MISAKTTLLFAGISLVSLTAGIFTAQWLESRGNITQPAPIPTAVGVPEHRVDFTLPDLSGQPRSLSEWDG
ncbi:MAG: TlpA family protein disulfide reductase, partial [Gammaproteobacteria bacterium]|nr:TlpA family protein disulfide reductase [Gammaproteobacteria bacterium]